LIEGKEKSALIDAAAPQEAKECIKKLENMGIIPDILILTHSHWDHAAGTSIFQEKYPKLEVMVGKTGIEALRDPVKFNEPFNDFPFLPELEKVEGLTTLIDGDKIDLGGLELMILETPGHTNCGISVFDPNHKMLFIGDSLCVIWTFKHIMPSVMPPEFSEEKYLTTIDKIKNVKYNLLALAHYGVFTDSDALNLPDRVKSAYFEWKIFFKTIWEKYHDNDFVIKKFVDRMNEKGIYDQPENKFTLEFFGAWMLAGLRSGNLI
ncbi:MAG: MBL fold metallo-hydrolase, partial [Promethearchaeota archaeon]